jgi:hypothetical protein
MATALAHAHPAVRTMWPTALLAMALAAAGAIHLALAPQHFADSALMGLGFGAAGLAQLALGLVVLASSWRGVYVIVIAVSLALMAMFAFNALVGLPFGGSRGGAVAGVATVAVVAGEHASGDDAHATAHAGDSGHHAEGLVLGGGEPVDALGIGTQAAQIAAIALAGHMLIRTRRVDRRRVVG